MESDSLEIISESDVDKSEDNNLEEDMYAEPLQEYVADDSLYAEEKPEKSGLSLTTILITLLALSVFWNIRFIMKIRRRRKESN